MPIDSELAITLGALAAAAVLAVWMILLERKPPDPGSVRLLPTTPVLFASVLVAILALAHLVTLVTGTPHVGRLG